MKEGRSLKSFGIGRTLLGALALVVLTAFAGPQLAEASTAANSVITNTVRVNYNNAAGDPQAEEEASVSVTVQLVAATPNLSAPGPQSTDFGVAAVYTYTLTATANGPDTYNLTESLTDETGITGSTIALSDASLALGATTLAADTDGTNTITVPYDGTDDGEVNGIAVGETIVINNVVYTVAAGGITEVPATNLATITLDANVPAGDGAAGDVVGEQQSFNLTVTPANDPAAVEGATITVTVTARDASDAAAATTPDETVTTVTNVPLPTLQVTKDVSVNGDAFSAGPANAVPGDILTYRITVTNTSASSNATSVVITDDEPQFTTYQAGTAKTSTTLNDTYGSGTNSDLTDSDADGDGYDFTGSTATYSAGTLAPNASVLFFFQVRIN